MIKKLYPNGKEKAFCLSYDDGVLEDLVFVELLNKYHLKATFNLNSGLMEKEFEWIHESGKTIKRLSFNKARHLYDGHEIASHSYSHPYMDNLSYEQIYYEMVRDKILLEQQFKCEINGFALPFDYLSPLISKCAKDAGFEYLRTSSTSNSYIPSDDYYNFEAGVFDLDDNFDDYIDGFFKTDIELAACQIIGHSYDLETAALREKAAAVFKRIAADKTVVNLTTVELVRYLKAMRTVTINNKCIINASELSLWFNIDGKTIEVLPKTKYYL